MRTLPYILALCCLLSCTKPADVSPVLEQAERLIAARQPDSAYHLLKDQRTEQFTEADRALWGLLLTQAMDKSYRTPASDSLIEASVRYYEKQGNTARLAVALYTQGRVYKELRMNKEAATCYLRSLDVAKGSEDYDTQFLASSQLGHIYAYSDFIDKALAAYQQSLTFAELRKDSVDLAYAYGYLGRVYGLQEDWERAIASYQRTIDISRQINEVATLRLGLSEQAAIYTRASNYPSAIRNMLELLQVDPYVSPQSYLTLGDIYREINRVDSAHYYLDKALKTKNIYTRKSVYQCLYLLYRENRNYEKALHFNDLYREYTDSIRQMENKEEVVAVESRFQQEKLKLENKLLQTQHTKNRFRLYTVIALLSVFFILGYTFFQHRLHRARRQELENRKRLDALILQLQQNEDSIRAKQHEIDQLSVRIGEQREIQSLLSEKQQEVEELRAKNGDLGKRIRKTFESFERRGVELAASQALLKQKEESITTTLRTLQRHAPIQPDQWELIFPIMDAFYQQFVVQLQQSYPELTSEDIRICCLMKLGHTARQIQTELDIQENTLSKRKQRIREKIDKNRKWNRGELDDFIKNFPNGCQ